MSLKNTAEFEFDQSSFFYALRQQFRVISALIVRETATRFGRRSLGFIWAFLEPTVYIALYVSLHTFIRAAVPYGESAMIFFTVGMLTFRLFTSIASHAMSAISANQALLTYPLVRPIDTIIARVILESIVMLSIFAVVLIFVGQYLNRNIIVHPDMFIEGMLATVFLATSIASFNAVVSAIYPTWSNIYSLFGLPLLVTSGLFYVPATLPPYMLSVISWNPVLHCIEWVRGSTYNHYLTVLDSNYLLTFSTGILVIALSLERIFRRQMIRP